MTDKTTYARLEKTLQKCLELSKDKSTTSHEREAARLKAIDIRAQMSKLEEPAYVALVEEGRAVHAKQEEINWILGELASRVDKKYGEGKLEQFAEDIGVDHAKLRECRATFLAWPQKVGRPTFSVARRLNPLPPADRARVVRDNPGITQREAKRVTAAYREAKKTKKPKSKSITKTSPRSRVPGLIELIDRYFAEESFELNLMAELEPDAAEKKQVAKSLGDLRKRVDAAITRWNKEK